MSKYEEMLQGEIDHLKRLVEIQKKHIYNLSEQLDDVIFELSQREKV